MIKNIKCPFIRQINTDNKIYPIKIDHLDGNHGL